MPTAQRAANAAERILVLEIEGRRDDLIRRAILFQEELD